MIKHPMSDPVPLAGSGWEVADGDGQARSSASFCTSRFQSLVGTIGAASIGCNQQLMWKSYYRKQSLRGYNSSAMNLADRGGLKSGPLQFSTNVVDALRRPLYFRGKSDPLRGG